tara:strand:+ start:597 stop:1718 length:1122 start_codon:yes stop_codon:yes gene_type:complete
MEEYKKTLVISAVNIRDGGALTILINLLDKIESNQNSYLRVIALVSEKKIFSHYKNVRLIEFPNVKKFWILRIIFEYVRCFFISKKIKTDIWFSLHDMTPNVIAKKRIVYCHNPAPFYKIRLKDIYFDLRFFLFNLFYLYLYKINIKKNTLVLVQQNWVKNELSKFVDHAKIKICKPDILHEKNSDKILVNNKIESKKNKKFIICYPAFPRTFKNIETICEAVSNLPKELKDNVELRLTISGKENKYSKYIYSSYKVNKNIKFLNKLSRKRALEEIKNCDILAFPSLLETFGLPIIEAKQFNKILLLADLPYAKETCGTYEKVKFIDPEDSNQWKLKIEQIVSNKFLPDKNIFNDLVEKVYDGWDQTIELIIK